ncbi:G5 domain-containing protein [Streptococcus himalayensis]|uniref:LysM peptidoglycan-binding domain-containing protein n=1 Tax=Streptococcus himalayensis TaxID=1888195 RepID=A0A917A2U1_9STRE|nr:G5 domain-containing protein [Streptococcus himalayensis]GGE23534.1 hypothetical protein GCM10011510_00740 [Streptococcus himalayensis]
MRNTIYKIRKTRTGKLLFVGAMIAALGGAAFASAEEVHAEEWTARSVTEIRADLEKEVAANHMYTVKWGDTLSAISAASGISVEALQSINNIGDAHAIVAGHQLYIDAENKILAFQNGDKSVTVLQEQDGDWKNITEEQKAERAKAAIQSRGVKAIVDELTAVAPKTTVLNMLKPHYLLNVNYTMPSAGVDRARSESMARVYANGVMKIEPAHIDEYGDNIFDKPKVDVPIYNEPTYVYSPSHAEPNDPDRLPKPVEPTVPSEPLAPKVNVPLEPNDKPSASKIDEKDPMKIVSSRDVFEKEPIPFSTIREADDTLFEGDEVVAVDGKDGVLTVKFVVNYNYKGDEISRLKVDEQADNSLVNKVVKYGTKKRIQIVTNRVTSTTPFETTTINDVTLPKGQMKVIQNGKDGEDVYEVTSEVDLKTGVRKEINRKQVSSRPAVAKIVAIGSFEAPKDTTETRRITDHISHGTVTSFDNNLFEGETRTEEGKDGYVVYEVTYNVSGLTGQKTEVSRRVVERVEAKNTIIYKGTKKRPVVTPAPAPVEPAVTTPVQPVAPAVNTRSAAPVSSSVLLNDDDVAIGRDLPWYKGLPKSALTFAQLSLDEKEKIRLGLDPNADVDGKNPYAMDYASANNLSQEQLDKLMKYIDLDKLNEEFLKLLNAERESKGLSKAVYDGKNSVLQKSATQRSKEMAHYGSSRYGADVSGKHKRPDGSGFHTVYSKDERAMFDFVNENALNYLGDVSVFQILNERWLAKSMFESWKASKGHYRAMMADQEGKTFHFAVNSWGGAHSLERQSDDNVALISMMSIGFTNN